MLENIKNSKPRLFFVVGPANTGNHLLHLLFENAERKRNGKKCFGQCDGLQAKSLQLLKLFAYPEIVVAKDFVRARNCGIKLKDRKNIRLKDIIRDFDGDIVYRVSVPVVSQYPPLLRIVKSFEDEGYETIWIVPIRDFYCTILSKISVKRCKTFNDGLEKLQKEYKYIFDAMIKHGGNFWLIPTSLIFAYPEVIVKEMKILYDLKVDENGFNQIFDADKRWRKRI